MARILLFALLAVGVCASELNPDFGILSPPPMCHCSSFASCQRKVFAPSDPKDKQIIVMSSGKNLYEYFHWDVISTVLSDGEADLDLMCYTHMKEKQYGFKVKLTNFMDMKNGSDLLWIANVVRDARNIFADYIVFDLLDALKEEGLNATHLAHFVQKLAFSVHANSYGSKLMCLLPWKPEMLGGDDTTHRLVLNSLLAYCDKFISGSPSYLSQKEGCKARATVPLTKLVYGVDEYLTQGIPTKSFFMGVPWHGFDYTCDNYNNTTNICTLKTTTGNDTDPVCEYESSRVKIGLGKMRKLWPEPLESVNNHAWERYSMAPYFTYKDKTAERTHQVWFEDLHSLKMKYFLSKDLDMGGVVVWYADDLLDDKDAMSNMYNSMIWNLMRDAMFKPHRSSFYGEQLRSFPSKMAGVGVGCMLLGTVLGFVIGAVICSKRRAGVTLRPPFIKDQPLEYHDDDARM